MEKARCNTELYSNLRAPLNNVKPSNFLGSHQDFIGVILNLLSRVNGTWASGVTHTGLFQLLPNLYNDIKQGVEQIIQMKNSNV